MDPANRSHWITTQKGPVTSLVPQPALEEEGIAAPRGSSASERALGPARDQHAPAGIDRDSGGLLVRRGAALPGARQRAARVEAHDEGIVEAAVPVPRRDHLRRAAGDEGDVVR